MTKESAEITDHLAPASASVAAPVSVECVDSIARVEAHEWNALISGQPFLRHEFLRALEDADCVGPGTTWHPRYVLARTAAGTLVGGLPLYLKYDSRGEFVFDWGWADAYERSGLSYYPKLVCAAPYTPATGARLLLREGAPADTAEQLLAGAAATADAEDASSIHVLFPADADREILKANRFLERKGCQFHWTNEDYTSFDDFLGSFTSSKRKKARRERRRIAEAGIRFEHLTGSDPSSSDWDAIYAYYSRTFHRRGREPYLNRKFFDLISRSMPDGLVIILARYRDDPIAVALCLRGPDALFGRYWGSLADFHSLHFEACYYQGIEYCIEHGLRRFEPGTQGEHKISRGFAPTQTWSYHWLRNPAFNEAIEEFLRRETRHVDAYIDELDRHLPYRQCD